MTPSHPETTHHSLLSHLRLSLTSLCPSPSPPPPRSLSLPTIQPAQEAEAFVIVDETAVAKGIRRVSGVTGAEATQAQVRLLYLCRWPA